MLSTGKKIGLAIGLFITLSPVLNFSAIAASGPLMASEATSNSIDLSWTAPGDDGSSGAASQYDIRYSLSAITESNWDQATQVVGEPVPQSAGSQESFTVTALQPNTTYYFAIKAADEVPNWSVLSNVISKTTLPEQDPPANIANLSVSNPTQSSLDLSWTAPGDDGSSGTAAEYDIRYSTSTITDANWDAATQVTGEPAPQLAGSAESMTISGLNANTTYYFAIKTADEVPNWSGLSNIASGATSEEPQPPDPPVLASPSNNAIDIVLPVTLDWNDMAGVDQYELQVDDDFNFSSPVLDSNLSQSESVVSGLNDNTTYFWRVRAHNSVGWGAWCSAYSFTTECPLPNIPTLATPADGESNITLPINFDWSDISGATGYHIQVDDQSNFADPEISVSTSSSQYSSSALSEEITYYWRVRANNDCGSGAWSAVRSFGTSDLTNPDPVADLDAAPGENNGEVTLTWTATGDDGTVGTASEYDIRYALNTITSSNWSSATQVSGESSPQTSGSAESFTVTGLSPSINYFFAIRVIDESGNQSDISNSPNAVATDKTPPASINDLSAETGDDDGQINLSWTTPGDDGMEGIASAYLIRYSKEILTESNWASADIYEAYIPPLQPGQTQYVSLQGLDAGEIYYIGVKAYDECANCTPLSNVEECESGFDFSLDIGDEVIATISPSDGALLHSAKPLLTVANVDNQEGNMYYFEIARDSFFIDLVAVSPPIPQQGGDITQWHVSQKLESDSKYYWRAKANDNPYCATLSFAVEAHPHVYPNPYRPSETLAVTFADIPDGSQVVLMSVSGSTVKYWADVQGSSLTWDGTNDSGNRVSPGTYLWFVENSDIKGKIVVLN